MIQILQSYLLFLLGLAALCITVYACVSRVCGDMVYRFIERKLEKLDAETHLLEEQASHVNQTAQVEKLTLEATIKAHEKQGANKLRTEIARVAGDRKKIEDLLGSKLDLLFKDYAQISGTVAFAPVATNVISLGSPAGSGQSSVGSP